MAKLRAILLASIAALGAGLSPAVAAPAGLTAREIIESPRILPTGKTLAGQLIVSPDGKHYVLPIVRGDLARDGNWLELYVGEQAGDRAPPPPRLVARLFTTSRRGTVRNLDRTSPVFPGAKMVWLDDSRRIVFLWNDGESLNQLVSVDTTNGEIKQITHHATSIFRFVIAPHGDTILFSALPLLPRSDQAAYNNGFVIEDPDYRKMASEQYDGIEPWQHLAYFVQRDGAEKSIAKYSDEQAVLSPSGRYMIGAGKDLDPIPADWPATYRGLRERYVNQKVLFDVAAGTETPLMDAPQVSFTLHHSDVVLWSPDERHVIVSPTYLPPAIGGEAGRNGVAVAVVDVVTHAVDPITLPGDARDSVPIRWDPDGTVVFANDLAGKTEELRLARRDGRWTLVERRLIGGRAAIAQGPNRPPELVWQPVAGHEEVLMAIAPKLRRDALGNVENIGWTDSAGRSWKARLFYPLGYRAGARYPLVVQTHGVPDEGVFTMLGQGDEFGSAYAAQPLAGRGMTVMQLQDPPLTTKAVDEAELFDAMLESGIDHLAARGLVDPGRVGLLGFSRTCWHIQYALTHSERRFAAADAVDGIDMGYLLAALENSPNHNFGAANGGPPFGASLAGWLERAPGFTVERIQAPLRLESGGGASPFPDWEMFSRLKALRYPVEYAVLPQFHTGDHPMQVPSQRLASEEGAVDWFDFWLNDHEDPDPAKRTQYARWQKLRAERDVVLSKPRPPALKWTATPIAASR